ncbi:hypothetical protein Acsp05_18350 [Actinokineospora sp. NBRC 105648]|nr:hypothetical protein Acsp05_18350 [Actinokineospora sp. NBRC 105648]
MPTADEADARTDAPRVVRAAFWIWVLAGVLGVVGAVLFFALREEWARRQVELYPQLRSVDVEQTATGLSWWLLVGSIMFFGFFLLLAHQARRGVRKARTLLLVLGVFATLFEYAAGRVTVYGLASALSTIVAVGMLYSGSARRFYRHDGER